MDCPCSSLIKFVHSYSGEICVALKLITAPEESEDFDSYTYDINDGVIIKNRLGYDAIFLIPQNCLINYFIFNELQGG